jgi:hypothetical protein
MKKKTLKAIISLVSSVIMVNSALCVNTFAVDTSRSWRYGMGDVLEDNDKQQANDMNKLKQYILAIDNLSSTQLMSADVNVDNNVTSADLLIMKKCVLATNGYDDESIDSMHVAISNSSNVVLQNMRDVIGAYIYKYKTSGWGYDANSSSRNYTINNKQYNNCRTDCSCAVTLALISAGVLNQTKLNNYGLGYPNTATLINSFSTVQRCVNSGYKLTLIELVPNNTIIYPGDIVIYPKDASHEGHTSVVISNNNFGEIPTSLSSGNGTNISVYGSGGDFASVHSHRLMPEFETIDLTSDGKTQSVRPYKYIIRVSKS